MNKLDELQCIAVEENPDIICITETWAHKDITDAELNLEGYNLVRNDRGHERRWLYHIHKRQFTLLSVRSLLKRQTLKQYGVE